MTERASKRPISWLTVFLAGLVVGLAWDQIRPEVVAQIDPVEDQRRATNDSRDPLLLPPDAAGRDAQLDRNYEQHFRMVDRTFAAVAQAVSPVVVHIVAVKRIERPDRPPRRFEETGSGVVVRSERDAGIFVLTNHHVVNGAQLDEITITFHDGMSVEPIQILSDAKADVAVLRLGRYERPTARLGDSDQVLVGQWVLALGSPFGLERSVSQGIISARGRYEPELGDEGVVNQDFIQTDAAINPGNSGGPLVNMRGEVIGINTAIASNGGGSEGVGFSIPINLARWILDQLVANGRVVRGAMGVSLDDLDPASALRLGLGQPHGALVLRVYHSAPAERAGIRDGDVILRYNGILVRDLNHLINLVSMTQVGRAAEVILWRNRRQQVVQVVVDDRDAVLPHSATALNRSGSADAPEFRP